MLRWEAEVYGSDGRLGKQLKYTDRSKIPLAMIYGSREKEAGMVKLTDLREATVTMVALAADGAAKSASCGDPARPGW